MCLAQGPQRSDAGEARTRGPSVSSQAPLNTESCAFLSKQLKNIVHFIGIPRFNDNKKSRNAQSANAY